MLASAENERVCSQANKTCRATVCDVSPTAVALLRQVAVDSGIDPSRVTAFAHDATDPHTSECDLTTLNADLCILIFTLSAVAVDDMASMLALAAATLKPGGDLLIRDYGLYDMTQLRFPPGQKLGERQYFRQAR